MVEITELLKNMVPGSGYLKASIKEGIIALSPQAKNLETVHISLDYPDSSIWRKKKYYHISKQEVCSQLDEWIFKHLIAQNEYAAFLDQYRSLKKRGEIDDIDEHILDTHYRPQAIKLLSRKRSFDLARWTKKRTQLKYSRRSNLYWKDGTEFRFDYRNSVQSLFILKRNNQREVIGIGGSGSSGQRQMYTFFTAVYYILSKKTRIPNCLFKYNSHNNFEYLGCKFRTIITASFGSNFDLDRRLESEIRRKGLF